MKRTRNLGKAVLRTIGWLLAEAFKVLLIVIGAMFGGSALSRQPFMISGDRLETRGQHGMRTEGVHRR